MNSLSHYKKSVTSYFGEDGIIEKIFETIGEGGKWCVEFGAVDGKSGSNTWNLIMNKGWSAVLIEANPVFYEKLELEYGEHKKVRTVKAFVGFEGLDTLDKILLREKAPTVIDFLCIDIDGADYHVWDALTQFTPRVVMIECNLRVPSDISFIQARDSSVGHGSSLKALTELGKRKGYELIYAGDMNAIFVMKEFFQKFGIADNAPSAFGATVENGAKFFQLLDGSVVLYGVSPENILLFKKKPKVPIYVQRGSAFIPIRINQNSFFVRKAKGLVKALPFYGSLLHPFVRRFYGDTWKKRRNQLKKAGEEPR